MKNNIAGVSRQKSWYPLNILQDPLTDSLLLFYLGGTWQGAADIGECLETASRVDETDDYGWTNAWVQTADRLHELGKKCKAKNHDFSAGSSFLRAATYYRAALHHYPDPQNRQMKKLARKAVDDFMLAAKLMELPVEMVDIPYEKTTLPGYFFRAEGCGKAPVMIVHSGRDSWAEDLMYIALDAIKRGYHCLLFDGPGQGKVIRLQGLPFRHDWENVIRPVVDFICEDERTDRKRMMLVGLSMGGFLAPRAAAFEKRLKLCVANPGVLNWFEGVFNYLNQIDPELMALYETDPARFDIEMKKKMEEIPLLRWGITDVMWKHGVQKPSELIHDLKVYNNEQIAAQIKCRMLIMDGTGEEYSAGQAEKLFKALRCPKDYLLFTPEEAAQYHCQPGALAVSNTRLFNWIDEHL